MSSDGEEIQARRKVELPRSPQVDALGARIRSRMEEIKDELTGDLTEKETNIRRGRYAELEELLDDFSFPKGIEP